MEHCKTCKHWKHHGPGAVWGDCLRIYDWKADPCMFDIAIKGNVDFGPNDLSVETHPDFGCVLHEERGSNETL